LPERCAQHSSGLLSILGKDKLRILDPLLQLIAPAPSHTIPIIIRQLLLPLLNNFPTLLQQHLAFSLSLIVIPQNIVFDSNALVNNFAYWVAALWASHGLIGTMLPHPGSGHLIIAITRTSSIYFRIS
jgi:hypothetical protein